jgi:hypothetical protein
MQGKAVAVLRVCEYIKSTKCPTQPGHLVVLLNNID